MHLHILGICGTFMGGIARLAVESGHKVTGSDLNCYPPMSDQLEALGIALHEGYDSEQLDNGADTIVVGNAMTRGKPVVEAMLNSNQKFQSGPDWLKENILADKWVVAVAGTHGKTTTASMVAWILEDCGYNPGFLIGGVMENFGVSARLTESPFFVVEADEYDTAFFDKRSKFVHYRGRTVILNNLEFDHADIFDDLRAIENQFHHLVRTIPGNGLLIRASESSALDRVLERGCWTPVETFNAQQQQSAEGWQANKLTADGSHCEIYCDGALVGELQWDLIGDHNVNNALAAIAAARHVGVQATDAIDALSRFKNVKRRMELKGQVNGVTVYDDFAHHPTAIATTIQGLRDKVGEARIIAIVDPRSNTMKMGVNKQALFDSVSKADLCLMHMPEKVEWTIESSTQQKIFGFTEPEAIVSHICKIVSPGDHILVMSNGGFGGIHQKLLDSLATLQESL